MVLVGNADDLSYLKAYCLGRMHCQHPQIRKCKKIDRGATVAVFSKNSAAVSQCLEYVLRDLSKITPV